MFIDVFLQEAKGQEFGKVDNLEVEEAVDEEVAADSVITSSQGGFQQGQTIGVQTGLRKGLNIPPRTLEWFFFVFKHSTCTVYGMHVSDSTQLLVFHCSLPRAPFPATSNWSTMNMAPQTRLTKCNTQMYKILCSSCMLRNK